jgi:hypothetical protein
MQSGGRSGCRCCSPPVHDGSKDLPGKPGPRQRSCGMCLCHGAVVNRHVEMPRLDQAVVAFVSLGAVALIQVPLDIESGFSTPRTACHFPAAVSGRELRALIESFLL